MDTTTKQAIGPRQEKWLTELESGKWQQGKRCLMTDDGHYCCLGVGCAVFSLPTHVIGAAGQKVPCGNSADLQGTLGLRSRVGKIAGLTLKGHKCLTEANDMGIPFPEIAAFCREHPEAVFTEPR